jgi:ABC-type Fe3+ transport system permease subunit
VVSVFLIVATKYKEVVQPVAVATPVIIIIGYVAQYALLPTRMMAASLQRILPSLERAAQLCRVSEAATVFKLKTSCEARPRIYPMLQPHPSRAVRLAP